MQLDLICAIVQERVEEQLEVLELQVELHSLVEEVALRNLGEEEEHLLELLHNQEGVEEVLQEQEEEEVIEQEDQVKVLNLEVLTSLRISLLLILLLFRHQSLLSEHLFLLNEEVSYHQMEV